MEHVGIKSHFSIYIIYTLNFEQLKGLRTLKMSESKYAGTMADNYRPIQKSNNRFIRTNIYFNASVSLPFMRPV